MRLMMMELRIPLSSTPGSAVLTVVFSLHFPTASTVHVVRSRASMSSTVQGPPPQSSEAMRHVMARVRVWPGQDGPARPTRETWRSMSPSSDVPEMRSGPSALYLARNLPLPVEAKVHVGSGYTTPEQAGKRFDVKVSAGPTHSATAFTNSPTIFFASLGTL